MHIGLFNSNIEFKSSLYPQMIAKKLSDVELSLQDS